jgi:transposase, IS30 family
MGACYEHLGQVDRLAIDQGRRSGLSVRAIARMLARAPSTVSRELKRMGPYWQHYVPAHAFFSALYRRRDSRRGARKLPHGSPLFAHVADALREGWSP